MLYYLVDALPQPADDVFDDATNGDAVLRLPTIAAAETLYKVEKNDTVAGFELSAGPSDVVAALESFVPVTVVGAGVPMLRELPDWMGRCDSQVHDAMILASHEASQADAIVTGDPKIATDATTVWD